MPRTRRRVSAGFGTKSAASDRSGGGLHGTAADNPAGPRVIPRGPALTGTEGSGGLLRRQRVDERRDEPVELVGLLHHDEVTGPGHLRLRVVRQDLFRFLRIGNLLIG